MYAQKFMSGSVSAQIETNQAPNASSTQLKFNARKQGQPFIFQTMIILPAHK